MYLDLISDSVHLFQFRFPCYMDYSYMQDCENGSTTPHTAVKLFVAAGGLGAMARISVAALAVAGQTGLGGCFKSSNFLYFSHAQSYIPKSATVPNPIGMRFLCFPMKILSPKEA
jgi:hypothetical protein